MGLLYTAAFRNVSLTANGSSSQDIIELVNAATQSLVIHQIRVTSQYNVDERIDLALFIRTGAAGSGGSSSITPSPRNPLNTHASGITSFKTLVTTPGVGGTNYELEADQWSQLAPYEYLWTPETRPEVPVSDRFCLNNVTTYVGGTRLINGFITWEER